MERSLEVRTGESIAIEYELAGLGSRFLAVMIDLAIQGSTALVAFVAFLLLAQSVLLSHFIANAYGKPLSALWIAVLVFAGFMLFFGYFIVFELWWSGRTPGKRLIGIRVVRDGGFPLDVGGAVIRNIVRILEAGLAFYALAAISTLISRENKRLGDFAAGTLVVRDRRAETLGLDAYLAAERPADDGLIAEDRSRIASFLARRAQLEPAARANVAAQIAARVRPGLPASFAHLTDEELLVHLGRP